MTESFQQQTPVPPQQPQGYPHQKETAPGAVASLVCGIIGVAIGCTGLILGIILIVFGVGKLPQVGGAIGKGLRAFRKGQRGEEDEEETPKSNRNGTKKIDK